MDLSDTDEVSGGGAGGAGDDTGDDSGGNHHQQRSGKLTKKEKGLSLKRGGGLTVGGGGGGREEKAEKEREREKEKKEKKSKEKETRYAHLGEVSSGEDEHDGKSPAKSKRSKPFMFGSAKKDKEKKKERDGGRDGSGHAPGVGGAPGGADEGGKKKDKKEKARLKLIKSSKGSHHADQEAEHHQKGGGKAAAAPDLPPIFGVPLEVSAARHKSHDGIPLPVIVRQCIDYIEEHGLKQEGIYRSSGVKSKINKLRASFNARQPVSLSDYEPSVVASVLKQFLRELPEPVLTSQLTPKFESVSADPTPQRRIEGMKRLMQALPAPNRALVQYVFVHMGHVIERERFNKMTLQNVSIVLSPTMQISHRVLNCIFENSHILFEGIHIKRYVPPLTTESSSSSSALSSSGSVRLPESPEDIEEEILKQESLLADLHLQISSGEASKKTEEQIWEQQRIVTQLKRKLRMVKKQSDGQLNMDALKPKYEPIDYEEELNFSLQTPAHLQKPASASAPANENKAAGPSTQPTNEKAAPSAQATNQSAAQPTNENKEANDVIDGRVQQQQDEEESDQTPEKASPDNDEDTEHKVTVMVHRPDVATEVSAPEAVRAQVSAPEAARAQVSAPKEVLAQVSVPEAPRAQVAVPQTSPPEVSAPEAPRAQVSTRAEVSALEAPRAQVSTRAEVSARAETSEPDAPPPPPSASTYVRKNSHVTVIRLNSSPDNSGVAASEISSEPRQPPPVPSEVAAEAATNVTAVRVGGTGSGGTGSGSFPLLPPPPASNKMRCGYAQILRPTPAPAPAASPAKKPPTTAAVSNADPSALASSARSKSKSLPRGLPSDGSAFAQFGGQQQQQGGPQSMMTTTEAATKDREEKDRRRLKQRQMEEEARERELQLEELQLEEFRVRFEHEELMTLKSELERRKRAERKEMEELREELATMQTLYQYRTYSVDSSESSSDEVEVEVTEDNDEGSGGGGGGGGRNAAHTKEAEEQLSKTLANLVRENKELEKTRYDLCQKIQEERAACVNLRVQIRVELERKKMAKKKAALAAAGPDLLN